MTVKEDSVGHSSVADNEMLTLENEYYRLENELKQLRLDEERLAQEKIRSAREVEEANQRLKQLQQHLQNVILQEQQLLEEEAKLAAEGQVVRQKRESLKLAKAEQEETNKNEIVKLEEEYLVMTRKVMNLGQHYKGPFPLDYYKEEITNKQRTLEELKVKNATLKAQFGNAKIPETYEDIEPVEWAKDWRISEREMMLNVAKSMMKEVEEELENVNGRILNMQQQLKKVGANQK